jgi:hypothetical protein
VQAAALTLTWAGYNREIASIVGAIDKLEPGSTLFTATSDRYPVLVADSAERRAVWSPPLKHVGSYAVLGSPVFVPMTWSDPTQQPLNVKTDYLDPYVFQGNNPRMVYDTAALLAFVAKIKENVENQTWRGLGNVYVLVLGSKGAKFDPLPPGVDRVTEGDRFVLFRVSMQDVAARDSR